MGFTYTLTFSCAKYESQDIENYLRKVNNVLPSYNIDKLCTEDPINISVPQLQSKIPLILSKSVGERGGAWYSRPLLLEKEYQARGVPHYHVLLWINDWSR